MIIIATPDFAEWLQTDLYSCNCKPCVDSNSVSLFFLKYVGVVPVLKKNAQVKVTERIKHFSDTFHLGPRGITLRREHLIIQDPP